LKTLCGNCGILTEGDECAFCNTNTTLTRVLSDGTAVYMDGNGRLYRVEVTMDILDGNGFQTFEFYPEWMREQQEEDEWYSTEVE